FGFTPLLALARPWTFLTYMFLHAGLLHLAFNLLTLFVFGPPVEERMGSRAFLGYYLLCGLGGAALSFALMLLRPLDHIVGASADASGGARGRGEDAGAIGPSRPRERRGGEAAAPRARRHAGGNRPSARQDLREGDREPDAGRVRLPHRVLPQDAGQALSG